MPVPRQRRGDGETGGVESAHEGEFFPGGEMRHLHPGGGGAVAEVVAVGFDGAEGDAAEAVDFQDALLLVVVVACLMEGIGGRGADGGRSEDDVNVGFFARADALAGRVQGFALEVGVQGEVVEAAVGEAVAVICRVLIPLCLLCVLKLSECLGNRGAGREKPWMDGGRITFRILHPCDQVGFRECGDGSLSAAAGAQM